MYWKYLCVCVYVCMQDLLEFLVRCERESSDIGAVGALELERY